MRAIFRMAMMSPRFGRQLRMVAAKHFGEVPAAVLYAPRFMGRATVADILFRTPIGGVCPDRGEDGQVQVLVRDNNVDQALKALKKKMQREGVFREMKLRRHYEKPSERRAREAAEAVRRARKMERKRLEREGF